MDWVLIFCTQQGRAPGHLGRGAFYIYMSLRQSSANWWVPRDSQSHTWNELAEKWRRRRVFLRARKRCSYDL